MITPSDMTTAGSCINAHYCALIIIQVTKFSESARAIGIIIENSELVASSSTRKDQ